MPTSSRVSDRAEGSPDALPDEADVDRARSELAEEWSRLRADVIARAVGQGRDLPEVVEALDRLTQDYLTRRADILRGQDPAEGLSRAPVVERLRALQQDYRGWIGSLLGKAALDELELERGRLALRVSAGAYRIPVDTF